MLRLRRELSCLRRGGAKDELEAEGVLASPARLEAGRRREAAVLMDRDGENILRIPESLLGTVPVVNIDLRRES